MITIINTAGTKAGEEEEKKKKKNVVDFKKLNAFQVGTVTHSLLMSALIFKSPCASAWGRPGRSEAILRCLRRPELHTLSFYLHINSDIDPAQSKNEGEGSERGRKREQGREEENSDKTPLQTCWWIYPFSQSSRMCNTNTQWGSTVFFSSPGKDGTREANP